MGAGMESSSPRRYLQSDLVLEEGQGQMWCGHWQDNPELDTVLAVVPEGGTQTGANVGSVTVIPSRRQVRAGPKAAWELAGHT